MNIDDLADRETGKDSPGERFHDDWLDDMPRTQWPSYIDESARLVADGIGLGNTALTKADFPYEAGEYYQRGLAAVTDVDTDETSLPIGNYSAKEIGIVAWTFNRLREEMRDAKYTDYTNPSRAIEAAINKALVEKLETGELEPDNLETLRLPPEASVSTLVSEIFCRPRSETYIQLLLETVQETATTGLLGRIEEPRMITPLWDHQREALEKWLTADCRGYVDMATATGKTFLGLAAIAHHFGALHPDDRDLVDERLRHTTDRRAKVVVLAHRELILDQWQREFDTHLNIPEKSETRSGKHTAEFEWGDVHFWTPDRLQGADLLEEDLDLVILDETHHYLGSSGFGSLLDDIDGHILALSGSLNEANARTLERRNIPKIYEFTLREGQRAGIIPQCDWDVVFTPYENQARLAEITATCRAGRERFSDGIPVPSHVDASETAPTFETLSEARSLAQSTVGREVKEENPEFRDFASAVKGRQLTKYNLSPTLSSVVHLVVDKIDTHKCVVLLETEDEIQRVTAQLESRLGDSYESSVTVFDAEDGLSTVEEFDQDQDTGAIIGVARTLGEGVDIKTADVCINRGRGRLSRSLVQRMGRILRNPDADKDAQFFHISGVPTRDDSTLPREDGMDLLETASQLIDWGEGFDARPVFTVDTETEMNEGDLLALEVAGAEAIEEWHPDHYEWPADEGVREQLQSLCTQITSRDASALLAMERVERETDTEQVTDQPELGRSHPNKGLTFVAADGGGEEIELAGWLYTAVEGVAGDVDAFVERAVRECVQETLHYPEGEPTLDAEHTVTVSLNPALDAVLSAYITSGSREAAVHAAVAEALEHNLESVPAGMESDITKGEVREMLAELSNREKT